MLTRRQLSHPRKISIPDKVTIGGVPFKVTKIADKAFRKNTKLTTLTIGNNVTSIGKNAFEGCKKLKTVTIGTKVKKIGAGAFLNCKKLSSIKILSSKITSFGSKSFSGIAAKAKVNLPASKKAAYTKKLKKAGLGK